MQIRDNCGIRTQKIRRNYGLSCCSLLFSDEFCGFRCRAVLEMTAWTHPQPRRRGGCRPAARRSSPRTSPTRGRSPWSTSPRTSASRSTRCAATSISSIARASSSAPTAGRSAPCRSPDGTAGSTCDRRCRSPRRSASPRSRSTSSRTGRCSCSTRGRRRSPSPARCATTATSRSRRTTCASPPRSRRRCSATCSSSGRRRTITQATTGPVTLATNSHAPDVDIRADYALIAVGAVDASGFSTSNLGDATMMTEMIQKADRIAILADSTKLDRRLFAQIAPLEKADYLITDAPPSPTWPPPSPRRGSRCSRPETSRVLTRRPDRSTMTDIAASVRRGGRASCRAACTSISSAPSTASCRRRAAWTRIPRGVSRSVDGRRGSKTTSSANG